MGSSNSKQDVKNTVKNTLSIDELTEIENRCETSQDSSNILALNNLKNCNIEGIEQ